MRVSVIVAVSSVIGLLAYSWQPVLVTETTDLPPANHQWIRDSAIVSQATADVD
jgi:hypothetical protein